MALEAFPRIDIDHQKCTTPFACKACIRICPTAIFQVPVIKMMRLQSTDKNEPGTFRLIAKYRDKCTGCNLCVEACPSDALNVYMAEVGS